jgi:biopolymer transport protein ExbD
MAMAVGKGEGQSFTDINMTPLIDVMLVLLIIFIISLPPVTHAVKIDNPLPPPPNFVPPPPPEIVNLTIDFDGTLAWNGSPVDRPTISVDKFAKYEKVAQTLADLQSRGLKKIGFVNNDLF